MRRIALCLAVPIVALLATGCAQIQKTVQETLSPTPRTTVSPRFDPREHERIAILVFDNGTRGRSGGLARQAEDEFLRSALARGYTVAARSDVARVVDELRLQASGVTAEEHAEELGRLLNVSAVLIVSIDDASTRREETYVLTSVLSGDDEPQQAYFSYATVGSRLVSVREAEVLWVSSLTDKVAVPSGDSQGAAVPHVSRRVAAMLPSRL